MRNLSSLLFLMPVLVLMWPTNVFADKIFCPPNPVDSIVPNDIVVNGEVCTLMDKSINGDVKVVPGGALIATTGTIIDGDVKCDGCNSVGILAGTINGDVEIKNAAGGVILTSGHDNTAGPIVILGDVKYKGNDNVQLFARGAVISGDLKVSENESPPMLAPIISTNTITGDLKCKENDLSPVPMCQDTFRLS